MKDKDAEKELIELLEHAPVQSAGGSIRTVSSGSSTFPLRSSVASASAEDRASFFGVHASREHLMPVACKLSLACAAPQAHCLLTERCCYRERGGCTARAHQNTATARQTLSKGR